MPLKELVTYDEDDVSNVSGMDQRRSCMSQIARDSADERTLGIFGKAVVGGHLLVLVSSTENEMGC